MKKLPKLVMPGVAVLALVTGLQFRGGSLPVAPARPHSAAAGHQPFLWGVSTAGFQSEGNDRHSNWAYWHPEETAGIEPAGRAVDFWNRYDEDMALAQSLGVNAFRLSVEWSRIEPVPGRWDPAAIAHYKAMFQALRRHGLTPIVTLSHWTMPAWVDEQGGWTNPEIPARYARFVEKVVTDIAPDCKLWLTFNEPNVWLVRDYLLGLFPPNRTSPFAMRTAFHNVLAGHALAYDLIHRHQPTAMVTVNLYHVMVERGSYLSWPLGEYPIDNFWFFDQFRAAQAPGAGKPKPGGRLDYLSYDYYYAFRNFGELAALQTPWLLPTNPARLETVIDDYDRRYGLPQLIAENGLATEDGKPRADGLTPAKVLAETVGAMKRAIAKGAPLMGYCYWTLTDNYEWGTYTPRFGLFSVDCRHDPALKRVPTPTADAYRQLIQGNTWHVSLP